MKFKTVSSMMFLFLLVGCAPAAPVMPTTKVTPETTLTLVPTQTVTLIPSPTATLSPEEQITAMVNEAKETGVLPSRLTEEQMIAFVDELEKQREPAPIYVNDPGDSNAIRLYVEDQTLMAPFVREILSQDNDNWYKVNKDFLVNHPELAKAATPYIWIPILPEIGADGKETGNKRYYDKDEGVWRIIPKSSTIEDNWQEPLNSIGEIKMAEKSRAFARPLGKNKNLVESMFEKYGAKGGYLPVVLLDPEKVMRLVLDPNDTSGYSRIDIISTMIVRHDKKANTSIGLRYGVTGIIWDILEGGTSKESPLNTEDFFKKDKHQKLLIEEGSIYYTFIPVDYDTVKNAPGDSIFGMTKIKDFNDVMFGNSLDIHFFSISTGVGQRILIMIPKE